MVECKLKHGQFSMNLYYRNDEDTIHYVSDSKDKLYIKHRTHVPLKVVFFDTLREMEIQVQKDLLEGKV